MAGGGDGFGLGFAAAYAGVQRLTVLGAGGRGDDAFVPTVFAAVVSGPAGVVNVEVFAILQGQVCGLVVAAFAEDDVGGALGQCEGVNRSVHQCHGGAGPGGHTDAIGPIVDGYSRPVAGIIEENGPCGHDFGGGIHPTGAVNVHIVVAGNGQVCGLVGAVGENDIGSFGGDRGGILGSFHLFHFDAGPGDKFLGVGPVVDHDLAPLGGVAEVDGLLTGGHSHHRDQGHY